MTRRALSVVGRNFGRWVALVNIAGVSVLGLYFVLSAVETAVYHYSFLFEQRPPSHGASVGSVVGYCIYGVIVVLLIYLVYAWMLALAWGSVVSERPSLRLSFRQASRAAPPNMWWGVPGALLVTVGSVAVVPVGVVPVLARIGFNQMRGEEAQVRFHSRRTWWPGVLVAMAMSAFWLLTLATISGFSQEPHLSIVRVVVLSACGWAGFVVVGVAAAFLATACALAFHDGANELGGPD